MIGTWQNVAHIFSLLFLEKISHLLYSQVRFSCSDDLQDCLKITSGRVDRDPFPVFK